MDEYVPGRLPYLLKWIKDDEVAEKGASFEARPSTKAICQRCQVRISYNAGCKEILKHVEKCWQPGPEKPVSEKDGRDHRPSVLGEVAGEVDTACQLFTVHSVGPCAGTYFLLVALPTDGGSLEKLDSLLRKVWFPDLRHDSINEDEKHLSMFLMSKTAEMDRTQLKLELQRLDLSVRGTDDELRVRLEDHWFRSTGGGRRGPEGVHWTSALAVNGEGVDDDEELGSRDNTSLEYSLNRGFLSNCANLDLTGMALGVTAGLLTPGRVVTVR